MNFFFLITASYSAVVGVVNLLTPHRIGLAIIFFVSEIPENIVRVFFLMRKEVYGWLNVTKKETRKIL